ncbi:hypothetical protein BKA70DRAFT_1232445 [Coprinopsis sp. MPI-PUGE-AT-0042]|nr:hypothetical protein BKA70DRAFT_1232445 [Coprinopsis sp. MPI-PUGE-AT-0042]
METSRTCRHLLDEARSDARTNESIHRAQRAALAAFHYVTKGQSTTQAMGIGAETERNPLALMMGIVKPSFDDASSSMTQSLLGHARTALKLDTLEFEVEREGSFECAGGVSVFNTHWSVRPSCELINSDVPFIEKWVGRIGRAAACTPVVKGHATRQAPNPLIRVHCHGIPTMPPSVVHIPDSTWGNQAWKQSLAHRRSKDARWSMIRPGMHSRPIPRAH